MSTPHNKSPRGAIAPQVLISGDPNRAIYVAENYLTEVQCHSTVRQNLVFTGVVKEGPRQGEAVTVMASGMGQASLLIYVHELFETYDVQRIIRIGTCGALKEGLRLGDIILGTSSVTNSNILKNAFNQDEPRAEASEELVKDAERTAKELKIPILRGEILAVDVFYKDTHYFPDPRWWVPWAEAGVSVVEMESAALYAAARAFKRKALTLVTVSDLVFNLSSENQMPPEQREGSGIGNMLKLALAL